MKNITEYLSRTIKLGGSDLHLAAGSPPAARVRGSLVALESEPCDENEVAELIRATMSETHRARLDQDWELDYAIEVRDLGRWRGNVHLSRGKMEAAYRYVPDEVPELDTLGHYRIIDQLCERQQGLILVTGVTGSGKTTTLASMVRRIAERRRCVIVTIEDPIEYTFSHGDTLIKQREVGRDTKDFSTALRQCLRQDPDVIVVSELRDLETIQIALTAAETGHLVLATLHTSDAPQSIDRIVDVFPAENQQQISSQLANSLEAVVCQRLLPRKDGKGRALATEVMTANHAIRTCIRDGKIEQIVGLLEIGARDGMHTIDECLRDLIERGVIERESALAHCRQRQLFATPADDKRKRKSIW